MVETGGGTMKFSNQTKGEKNRNWKTVTRQLFCVYNGPE